MGIRKPLKWDGGVNLYADPRAIRDTQLAYGRNAFPTLEGLLHKRESVQAIGWTEHRASSGTILGAQPVALFVPDPITGVDFILHGHYGPGTINGEWLAAVQMGIIVQHAPGANHPSVYSLTTIAGSPPARPASFTNYRGRVIALAGGNEGFAQYVRGAPGNPPDTWSWVHASFVWDATAAGVGSAQTQAIQVKPQVACSFRGRMVYLNFGPGMSHWAVWADLNAGVVPHTNTTTAPLWARVGSEVLAENGNHVEFQDIVGETIVAAREVSLASITNPLQTALLVLTQEGSALLITGEPVQTTDTQFNNADGFLGSLPGNVSKVNYRCGGQGPGALCRTPYGTFWCSDDDVWVMPSASPQPLRVATNIRPAIQAVPPALRQYVSLTYADATLFLSLPTANSTSERNMAIEHWRMDLYDGLPSNAMDAAWFGPQDYGQMSAWLGGGQVFVNGGEACLSPSIVTLRRGGKESVVGVALAADHNARCRTFFVSFNEDDRALDIPFQTVTSGLAWADNTGGNVYAAGDIVRPTAVHNNGHFYIARNAGAPGAAEPAWPTGVGATVVDGAITWEEIQGATFWTRLINFYAATVDPSVTTTVRLKDDNWGSPTRDKILRRIDMNAYFGTGAWALFRAIINQGAKVGLLGPVRFAGHKDYEGGSLTPSLDEDGVLEGDGSALSNASEALSFKPKTPDSGRAPITGIDTSVVVPNTALNDTGIVRGTHIQPEFLDLSGIVIDDSNDQISWAFQDNGFGSPLLAVFTASITHGWYPSMDSLMSEIVIQMNAVQGVNGAGAFDLLVPPWNFTSAFTSVYPYLTKFTFTFDARNGAFIALIFGPAPEDPGQDDQTTLQGVTVYPCRSARLLSLLGMDTSLDYTTHSRMPAYSFADGRDALFVGEGPDILQTPGEINGSEVVPYTRPATFRIASIEAEAAVTPGLPLVNKSK